MITANIIKIIAWVLTAAFLCQLPVLALQHPHDPLRVSRSADPLDASINHLKALARVTAGIHLTQQLINGTDKIDEITAELLKTEPVTPSQITDFKAAEFEAAINSMKSLQEDLKSNDKIKKVEANWKLMIEMSKLLDGITDYKQWPGKSDFKTAMEKVKNDGIDVTTVETLPDSINWLEVNLNNLADMSSVYATVKELATKIANLIGQLKPEKFKFSDKGTATELSSIPVNIINSVVKNDAMDSNFFKTTYISDCKENVKRFLNVGSNFNALKPQFAMLKGLISSRNTFGASRLLNYTSGLPNGHVDLSSISTDVNSPWMLGISNTSKLEYAIESLKRLSTPMTDFSQKLMPLADKSDTIDDVYIEMASLLAFSAKLAEGTAAVDAMAACKNVADFDMGVISVATIETTSKAIDDVFANVRDAISAFQREDAVTKLKELADICDKAKEPNADLAKIKTDADQFKPFIAFMKGIVPKLTVNVTTLKSNAGSAFEAADKVQSNLDSLTPFHTLFGCVKINNLDVVTDAINMIERYRLKKGDTKRFDEAVTASKAVASTSSDLTTIKKTMTEMKGKSTAQTKALNLLRDPKKTSEGIAKSVQAVVLMDEVYKKKADVSKVVQHLDLVAQELPNGFDPADTTTLTALFGLKPSFAAMETSVDTWHSAVKNTALKTLADAKDVFTPSKSVTGVKGDIVAMTTALERLVEAVPNSTNKPSLDALHDSLKSVSTLHLDFASFTTALSDVDKSMNNLKAFFTGFADEIAATDSSGSPSNRKGYGRDGKGALGKVSGDGSNVSESKKWYKDDTIIGIVVAIIVGIVACIIIGVVMRIREKRKDREIARLHDQLAEAQQREKKRQEHVLKGGAEGQMLVKQRPRFMPRTYREAVGALLEPNENETADINNDVDNIVIPVCEIGKIEKFVAEIIKLMQEKEDDEVKKKKKARQNNMSDKEKRSEDMNMKYSAYQNYLKYIWLETNNDSPGDNKIVQANMSLTRYNISLVKDTRITVIGFESDFLHANTIRCVGFGPILIGMEGPLGAGEKPGKAETCERTWQALRQQNVTDIIMLCQFFEEKNGTMVQKCGEYFPAEKNQVKTFGNVKVTCVRVENMLGKDLGIENDEQVHIVVRQLHVLYKREITARYFTHYQHVQWPDQRIPEHMGPLLWLLRNVGFRQRAVAVHCSAGIGRTGVFSFILYATLLIEHELMNNNLYAFLSDLRHWRAKLVQTVEQLGYAIQVLIEFLLNGREQALSEQGKKDIETLTECFRFMSKENYVPQNYQQIIERKKKEKVAPEKAMCRQLLEDLDAPEKKEEKQTAPAPKPANGVQKDKKNEKKKLKK